jgi:YYY domain-containing protein
MNSQPNRIQSDSPNSRLAVESESSSAIRVKDTSIGRRIFGALADGLLILCILAGLYFRFAWVNWSQGGDLHPDEYGLTGTITRLSLPDTFGDYFNTRLSTLSPYPKYDMNGQKIADGPDNRMRWGQWPQIIIRASAEGMSRLAMAASPYWNEIDAKIQGHPVTKIYDVVFTDYANIRLLGRSLSAGCDALSLLVLFLLALRLFHKRRLALLATALSALAVMQIQQSHFMTIDNFAVLFSMLTMYATVRIAQNGGWGWYGFWGCFLAMTLASRSNLAPLGGMILLAIWFANREMWEREDLNLWVRFGPVIGKMILAGFVMIVAIKIAQPMTFRAATGDTTFFTIQPNQDWVDSMKVAINESNGGGGPPSEQWTNRPAILFPLINMVVWGMGVPLGVAGWVGLLMAVWYIYKGRDWETHLIPVVFTAGLFVFLGTRWVKSMRYFLAIYPFLCLYAAWGLMQLWNWGRTKRWGEGFAIGAACFVVLGTFAWAWGFTNIYRNDNTRIQASRWIYQNVPAAINVRMTLPDGQPFNEPVPFNTIRQIDSTPMPVEFRPRNSGTVSGVSFGWVRDVFGNPETNIRVQLSSSPDVQDQLAECNIRVPALTADPRGAEGACAFPAVALTQNDEDTNTYYLFISTSQGGPVSIQGASIANESWDEGLPQRLDGRDGFGGLYLGETLDVRWPDDENKRSMFIQELAKSDYIIMPSQRSIWSASRLPASYPMTLEYYRALFDGRLGFEQVAQFQRPIQIGSLAFSDLAGSVTWNGTPSLPLLNDNPLAAEEAFTVYDHAPVWIFHKRADFSLNQATAILTAVDVSHTPHQDAHQATDFPTLLMLPLDRWQQDVAGGTWSEMFSRVLVFNQYPGLAALLWWLWALVTGWAALPLVGFAFRGLPDEGYSLAKIAGWVMVAWAAWMLSSFQVPFTQLSIFLCWLALLLAGTIVGWRQRDRWKRNLRTLWKTWLAMEILFAAFFLFDLLIRLGNGDLWHPAKGGEKPMDFAYLNAVIRSTSFPPYDPWFAGGYMNYYYYGFVLAAIPTKLLATVPSIAYNLLLPLFFGTIGMSAYGLAWNLTEGLRRKTATPVSPWLAGLASALMIMVLGNLGEVQLLWQGLVSSSGLAMPKDLVFGAGDILHAISGAIRLTFGNAHLPFGQDAWYWNASRMIPVPYGPNGPAEVGPITEFPFFTLLYADLHAHMIAIPIMLLGLGGIIALVMAPHKLRSFTELAAWLALTSLAVGALWPTNTWNVPTAYGLAIVGFLFAGWRMLSETTGVRDARGWIRIAIIAAVFFGLTVLLYKPYYQWSGPSYTSFGIWNGSKTPWDAYMMIHGLFLFLLVTYVLWHLRDALKSIRLVDARQWLGDGTLLTVGLVFTIGAVVLLAILGYQVVALTLPLLLLAVLLGLRPGIADEHRIVFGLLAASLALGWLVEGFVLVGDIDRMNTVFKFYIQSWCLLSIAAGVALGWLAGHWDGWRPILRQAWLAILGALAAGCLFYTVQASMAKIQDRMANQAPRTLDGMEYMQYAHYGDEHGSYNLDEDYRAIQWMQENVPGSPVIVEANLFDLYRWGNRFSIYTGLPDVVGWNWHQRQQRGVVADQLVWDRGNGINTFYTTTDIPGAVTFLRKYEVAYVIVGRLERATYPVGLEKFEEMTTLGELRKVYEDGDTIIYQVTELPRSS